VTAPAAPHVGTVLGGRYDLVRHIARGGMGDVYEAHDQLLERRVAVKLYRAASPVDRSRFDAEVKVLAGLNHRGLVHVHDAGAHGDDAYVVLELIDGPPLSDSLRGGRGLPVEQVRVIGAQLADALDYIHQKGVVHRDVTPSNILCDPNGQPRLVDFGIARLLESPRVTATSVTIGTAAFMAPEQVQGHEVTPAADVYALGLVLLEALTGRREFAGSMQEVAIARLARDPDTTTGVPGAWQPLLHDMVQRDPANRPTAAAVRGRLLAMATAADQPTAPMPAGAALPLTSAGDLDTTAVLETSGGTEVLPVPLPIPDGSPRRRLSDRIPAWVWIGGLAAAMLIVLALSHSAGGGHSPAATTTSTVAVVAPTTPVTTTVVTTTPPRAVITPPHAKDKGPKGHH
jgi:serine/threonine protein kinase